MFNVRHNAIDSVLCILSAKLAKTLGIPDLVFLAWGLTNSFYDCDAAVRLALEDVMSFLEAKAALRCQGQLA